MQLSCPKRPTSHAASNFTGRFQVQYKVQVCQLRLEHIDDHYCTASCPKRPTSHAASNFMGRFQVQYKVQVRQLRLEHVDDHYCAAMFKFLREYSIKVKDVYSHFSDDKSKIDIGEPGALVSTGGRGKKTLAPSGTQLSALDHDVQSKSSLTPSVTMICDTPDNITFSFYRGDVRVCLKDAVFQQSSPFSHATELSQLLNRRGEMPPIVLLYTDGGPDPLLCKVCSDLFVH